MNLDLNDREYQLLYGMIDEAIESFNDAARADLKITDLKTIKALKNMIKKMDKLAEES